MGFNCSHCLPNYFPPSILIWSCLENLMAHHPCQFFFVVQICYSWFAFPSLPFCLTFVINRFWLQLTWLLLMLEVDTREVIKCMQIHVDVLYFCVISLVSDLTPDKSMFLITLFLSVPTTSS